MKTLNQKVFPGSGCQSPGALTWREDLLLEGESLLGEDGCSFPRSPWSFRSPLHCVLRLLRKLLSVLHQKIHQEAETTVVCTAVRNPVLWVKIPNLLLADVGFWRLSSILLTCKFRYMTKRPEISSRSSKTPRLYSVLLETTFELLWFSAGGNPGSEEMPSSQSVPWQGEGPETASGVTFRDTAAPNQLAMGRTRNTLQSWLKTEIPGTQSTLKG